MSTVAEIFTQKIADRLKSKPDVVSSVNATFVFQLSGDGGGAWTIDLKKTEDFVYEGAAETPDLTVKMAADDFLKLVEGKLNPQMAFMGGKLKFEPTSAMSLALKLQQVLG